MGGACSTYAEMKNAYKIFIGKPERKKQGLGRYRYRWDDNIKVDTGGKGRGLNLS
jgi:hypothetical protein